MIQTNDLIPEQIMLVPSVVAKKARELFKLKLYEAAYEILTDNSVRFDIYEGLNKMEVSISVPKKNQAFDSKRGKFEYKAKSTKYYKKRGKK